MHQFIQEQQLMSKGRTPAPDGEGGSAFMQEVEAESAEGDEAKKGALNI